MLITLCLRVLQFISMLYGMQKMAVQNPTPLYLRHLKEIINIDPNGEQNCMRNYGEHPLLQTTKLLGLLSLRYNNRPDPQFYINIKHITGIDQPNKTRTQLAHTHLRMKGDTTVDVEITPHVIANPWSKRRQSKPKISPYA